MSPNHIRVFSDLVSIDAWHKPFTARKTSVNLHADLTFMTARLGAEPESQVRFKLRLKQAYLTAVIRETETIVIEKATVARFYPESKSIKRSRSTSRQKQGAGAGLSAKASSLGTGSLTADAHVKQSIECETSDEITTKTAIKSIFIQHSLDEHGNNRWRFTPGTSEALEGKPWEATASPLFKIKDSEPAGSRKLEPCVLLEITCRREDLEIFDITCKPTEGLGKLKILRQLEGARLIAAEAFIRNRIEEAGLPSPNMSEDYAIISIANTTSMQE